MKLALIALPLALLLLAGCANKPIDDRIAQGEAVVGELTRTVNDLYEPCVDGDPNNEARCLLTTEDAQAAFTAAKAADVAFDNASAFVAAGIPNTAEDWLRRALSHVGAIQELISIVKGVE